MKTQPTKRSETNDDVAAFLEKVKAVRKPDAGRRGRLVFALDATMSRQPTWDMACSIQGEMFEATKAIGGLDVQLVYFRGYGECKAGRWQPDAAGLSRLMSRVECHAGRTQIGKVLSHIRKETTKQRIGAAVYVGDAFEEDIDKVCHVAGNLGLFGVPVFLFQEGHDPVARKAFQEIARLTNGAWCPFDQGSGDRLKALLSAVAIYASGGIKALESHSRGADGEAAVALLGQLRKSGPGGG